MESEVSYSCQKGGAKSLNSSLPGKIPLIKVKISFKNYVSQIQVGLEDGLIKETQMSLQKVSQNC